MFMYICPFMYFLAIMNFLQLLNSTLHRRVRTNRKALVKRCHVNKNRLLYTECAYTANVIESKFVHLRPNHIRKSGIAVAHKGFH
jgi:hypothetical protein